MPEDDVEVPEWGGVVHVRAISSAELARAQRQATNSRGVEDGLKAMSLVVVAGCLDPKFVEGRARQLQNKEPGLIHRIGSRILELSGLGDEDEEDDDLGESSPTSTE